MTVQQTHELKDTISADYFVPGHDERTTTALFTRTKKLLIEREGGRCFVTNMTAEELGAPLQAHHHPVERCFATAWVRTRKPSIGIRSYLPSRLIHTVLSTT
jgi:hypothetical protein